MRSARSVSQRTRSAPALRSACSDVSTESANVILEVVVADLDDDGRPDLDRGEEVDER